MEVGTHRVWQHIWTWRLQDNVHCPNLDFIQENGVEGDGAEEPSLQSIQEQLTELKLLVKRNLDNAQ